MDLNTYVDHRRRLGDHLRGSGLELGPGHMPVEMPPGATVRYIDRWTPDQNIALFPELSGAAFPRPAVITNFDTDRLPIASESQDFVICSHVLEHLAEPLGFITEIHRVLRYGGNAVIFLPDRHRTFDRHQNPTQLAHLVAEHEAGVSDVDDDHIRTFLERSDVEASYREPEEGQDLTAFYEWHRTRSIHAHYWDEEEFGSVLLYGIQRLGHRWTLIQRMHNQPDSDEFGVVVQRSGSRSRWRTIRRFRATWRVM